jgi:hypothetical protein
LNIPLVATVSERALTGGGRQSPIWRSGTAAPSARHSARVGSLDIGNLQVEIAAQVFVDSAIRGSLQET